MAKLLSCLLLFLAIISRLSVCAQTFSATPMLAIAENGVLETRLDVSGLPRQANDTTFGLESVCLNLTHNEVKHLILSLYAPDGTLIKLTHLNGRENDFQFTCFRDDAKPLAWAKPPYTGAFRPIVPLGAANNGHDPNGSWRLVVEQYLGDAGDFGILERWSLTFGDHPAPYPMPASSDLPVLRIGTGGRYIPDEPKIAAHLEVVQPAPGERAGFRAPPNAYNGPIGIEWHGASSKSFWQPSYGIETRDDRGDDRDVALLGLPAGSDWVLHGPFTDKSLLRNALTFTLAAEAGVGYVPRARFCELVLDGAYLGVYLLLEKIKRGPHRVNIAKLTPADRQGDARSGGYIFRVDRGNQPGWYSSTRSGVDLDGKKVYFNYIYPKAEDLNAEQTAYIQAYVDSFEQALLRREAPGAGVDWRQFADEDSFVEFFLFNEVCKNVDAYRLSSYLYKPRDSDGGKLHAGPLWDFNLAWRNADYNDNERPAGWTFDAFDAGVPFWWRHLLQDALFAERLQCRWQELRSNTLSQRHIFRCIDSLCAVVREAKDRHFDLYPILGHGVWPNPKPIAKTHEAEIATMKTWISERLLWIDRQLPNFCTGAAAGLPAPDWIVYPNPAPGNPRVYFEALPLPGARLELIDLAGRVLARPALSGFEISVPTEGLPPGLYILQYTRADGQKVDGKKIALLR